MHKSIQCSPIIYNNLLDMRCWCLCRVHKSISLHNTQRAFYNGAQTNKTTNLLLVRLQVWIMKRKREYAISVVVALHFLHLVLLLRFMQAYCRCLFFFASLLLRCCRTFLIFLFLYFSAVLYFIFLLLLLFVSIRNGICW